MAETIVAKRQRAVAIDDALQRAYPASTCALDHQDAFQLLVATVLSAQTTDWKVNQATPDLFADMPDARAMARHEASEIEAYLQSIGLWRAKARNLAGLARALVEHHGGEVPDDLDALVALPGVGYKTATAVLGTWFGRPVGVTVDTHMLRINALLRLSRATQADKMARDLERTLPRERWTGYTHRIIDHGRLVCVARRPRCGVCPVQELCPSAFLPKVGYKPANDEKEPASARWVSWQARNLM